MVRITVPEETAVGLMTRQFVHGNTPLSAQVKLACLDGYKRLLAPSMETEARIASKTVADREAVRVFAENIRELLLAAPLGQKRILAIDGSLDAVAALLEDRGDHAQDPRIVIGHQNMRRHRDPKVACSLPARQVAKITG